MASTKTLYTIVSTGTFNAAASTTTGIAVSTQTAYGGAITVKMVNSTSNPTVAPQAHVLVSGDATAYKTLTTFYGDTVTSSVNEFAVDINPGYRFVNVKFDSNTVVGVSTEAFFHELTTV